MHELSSNPLASAQVVSICKHSLELVGGAGRIQTLRCPVCCYELNVFGDHLRAEQPRLQLSDEEHQRLERALDGVHNAIVEIAQTLRVLASGEANPDNMRAEIIDRIGKLGHMQDGLDVFKAVLDLPDPPSLSGESDEADPDWLSPDDVLRSSPGAITAVLDGVEIDEPTEKVKAVHE